MGIGVLMDWPPPSSTPLVLEGAGGRFPRGPSSLAPGCLLPGFSAAAAPLPRSPGTFCANRSPGPTPRQTPGSRPEEARGSSTAPREPDPRGGVSGSNLNTSPSPPRLPRPSRGVLAPGRPSPARRGLSRTHEGVKHLLYAETPAEKRRVAGGGREGREGEGSPRKPGASEAGPAPPRVRLVAPRVRRDGWLSEPRVRRGNPAWPRCHRRRRRRT